MTELTSPESTPPKGFSPDSVLGNLAERSKKIEAELFFDLRIPRWEDPELWVKFKPASFAKLRETTERAEKAKKAAEKAEITVNGHMDVLIDACVGVYALIDGEQFSLGEDINGDLTRFDQNLAARFEMEDTRARAVVRELYKTDGDILGAANRLAELSGYGEQELQERTQGE